jgi:hypothetical protein
MSDSRKPENVDIVPRDMSRIVGKKRTFATIRKQRERTKLRKANRTKAELWISPDTKALLRKLTSHSGRGTRSLMDMVMEQAGNDFLRLVVTAWEQVARHGEMRQQFERYGFNINLQSTTPIRFQKNGVEVVLDPVEYRKAQSARLDLDAQLRKWGFDKEIVGAGGIRRYRARRKALKRRTPRQPNTHAIQQPIQRPKDQL